MGASRTNAASSLPRIQAPTPQGGAQPSWGCWGMVAWGLGVGWARGWEGAWVRGWGRPQTTGGNGQSSECGARSNRMTPTAFAGTLDSSSDCQRTPSHLPPGPSSRSPGSILDTQVTAPGPHAQHQPAQHTGTRWTVHLPGGAAPPPVRSRDVSPGRSHPTPSDQGH